MEGKVKKEKLRPKHISVVQVVHSKTHTRTNSHKLYSLLLSYYYYPCSFSTCSHRSLFSFLQHYNNTGTLSQPLASYNKHAQKDFLLHLLSLQVKIPVCVCLCVCGNFVTVKKKNKVSIHLVVSDFFPLLLFTRLITQPSRV